MQKQLPTTAKRILVALCFVVAFVVMASIFSPDRTKASDVDLNPNANLRADSRFNHHDNASADPHMQWYNQENGIDADSSTDAHEGLRSLGSLESVGFTVQIYSTDSGARYSVYEKSTGKLIDTLLTPAKMQEKYPELNLPQTDFSVKAEGSLGMAEPVSADFVP